MMDTHTQNYLGRLKETLLEIDESKIGFLKERIKHMMGSEMTLFIAGNGGSAATSSHMACDLSKSILGKNPREKTKRLRVISLNDAIPTMTAWGNDEGYKYIFSEQLKNLGRKGDMLLIITGSGNSENILEAVQTAKKKGMETFGLLGFDGGKVKDMLDHYLLVESGDYGIIEDIHGIINHLITDYFKKLLHDPV